MGICASCLGLSNAEDREEQDERSHLLPRQRNQHTPHHQQYEQPGEDNANTSKPAQPQIVDVATLLGDDQDESEQSRLSACWKGTSDKLIDISLLYHTPGQPLPQQKDRPSVPEDPDSAYATQASIDYERLFSDTLPRKPHPSARPTIRSDTFTPPKTPNGDMHEPANEQQWLRDIIMRDPNDKSWDPNTVHKIGKPLLVNFDDVLAREENLRPSKGAVKAAKDSSA